MAEQGPPDVPRQTTQEWPGFRPVNYSLNVDVIFKIPINDISGEGNSGASHTTPTTVGEAFKYFNGWMRKEGEDWVGVKGDPIHNIGYPVIRGLTVETSSGKKRFSGTPFAERLLYTLLNLRKEEINPYAASWFFYDQDYCLDDPNESFSFFLVFEDKIVQERINLFRHLSDKDFDPTVLHDPLEGLEPIWADDDSWREAETAFWYRKFYTETKTGQLMLLRTDEPEIYYYDKGQHRNDQLKWPDQYPKDQLQSSGLGSLDRRLQRTNILLTLLLVLALLAIILRL